MKKINRTLAFVMALAATASLAACGNGDTVEPAATVSETTPAKELSEEEKAVASELVVEDAQTLEKSDVKWLATYDINPEKGKPKMLALEMFEQQYGGKIVFQQTSWDNRYNDLATGALSGDGADFFPAQEFDTFPGQCINGLFVPWDEYIDFATTEWTPGAKVINDMHVINGKHYMAAVATDSKCVMFYNKKTIEENGLDDPAELLANDNWTWDTFKNMLSEYCSREEDHFAYDSWYFETQFSLTTGVPAIGMKDGKVVSNIDSPELERVQMFMYELKQNDWPLPKAEYNWTEQKDRMAAGTTLFWPCGTWAIYEADNSWLGQPDEIAFVPMPRDPDADAYYLPASVDGYALCKGGQNPEGAAAYIKCKVLCEKDPRAKEISDNQFRTDYGWTDELLDSLEQVKQMTDAHPCISIHMGLPVDVANLVDDAIKQASFSGKDWMVSREEISLLAQTTCDELNTQIEAMS